MLNLEVRPDYFFISLGTQARLFIFKFLAARIFISKNLLLEFCKYNNMFICNGRMCNDKGVGKFTSKDASVVDYVIGSISFLKLVRHFSVLDASKLFSDIHTPLSLKVTCAKKPNEVTQKDETP